MNNFTGVSLSEINWVDNGSTLYEPVILTDLQRKLIRPISL